MHFFQQQQKIFDSEKIHTFSRPTHFPYFLHTWKRPYRVSNFQHCGKPVFSTGGVGWEVRAPVGSLGMGGTYLLQKEMGLNILQKEVGFKRDWTANINRKQLPKCPKSVSKCVRTTGEKQTVMATVTTVFLQPKCLCCQQIWEEARSKAWSAEQC